MFGNSLYERNTLFGIVNLYKKVNQSINQPTNSFPGAFAILTGINPGT